MKFYTSGSSKGIGLSVYRLLKYFDNQWRTARNFILACATSPVISGKGRVAVDFSSQEEFEVHVHKCFGQIFDRLMKIDAIVKEGVEREEQERKIGPFNELRDYMEEVILHCHLAWQYHRLSRMSAGSTWDRVQKKEAAE